MPERAALRQTPVSNVPPTTGAGAVQQRAGVRRVLVTGGAGFIGSHLCEALVSRGDDVTVVDDLSTGSRANLSEAVRLSAGRVRLVEGRVTEALGGPLRGERFDEIYHLAAAVGVRLVVEDPAACITTNIEETARVLEFAAQARGREGPSRVLIASSSEVYGKSARLPFREDDDVVYGATSVPRWSYALSKAVDEHMGLAAFRTRGVPVVVARFFNTVGPRQVGRYGMVLPRFVGAALRGEDLLVHGDGGQTRCFCDVRDVAPALPRLLGTPACVGGVFNVGSDQPVTIRALAETVLRVTGSASRILLQPYEEAYGPSFEDLRDRRPDLARVRGAIGFAPTYTLEQTVRDVAAFLRSSPAHAGGGQAPTSAGTLGTGRGA